MHPADKLKKFLFTRIKRNITIPYFHASFIIVLMLLVSCGTNEELKNKFDSDISSLTGAYTNRDWDKVTGLIYPEFFKAVPKQTVIKSLAMLDSLGMKRIFSFKGIDKINGPVIYGGNEYYRVFYKTVITVSVSKPENVNLKELTDEFNEDYGENNVKFQPDGIKFTINALQSVIAVSAAGAGNWKYLELNNEHAFDIVASVLPAAVMKALGGKNSL